MKIISWNVNGIRACVKKGFLDYLKEESPDMICLQETKIAIEDLDPAIKDPSGYYGIWHSAKRKGYSGTAILTKHKPISAIEGFGNEKYDCEGRVTIAEFDTYYVLSVYFPNGQQGDERLQYKLDFYRDFFEYCNDLKKTGKGLIICGDYNTAHYPIDLARPKENEAFSSFL